MTDHPKTESEDEELDIDCEEDSQVETPAQVYTSFQRDSFFSDTDNSDVSQCKGTYHVTPILPTSYIQRRYEVYSRSVPRIANRDEIKEYNRIITEQGEQQARDWLTEKWKDA